MRVQPVSGESKNSECLSGGHSVGFPVPHLLHNRLQHLWRSGISYICNILLEKNWAKLEVLRFPPFWPSSI